MIFKVSLRIVEYSNMCTHFKVYPIFSKFELKVSKKNCNYTFSDF